MKTSRQSGYTLIELLITIFVFVVIPIIITITVRGNIWYTEEGVLRQLKKEYPGVSEIIKDEKGLLGYSEITVRENGKEKKYFLDSNIFFNYRFSETK